MADLIARGMIKNTNKRIDETLLEFKETNQVSTSLTNGVQVIDAGKVNAPLDLEIEGRTLIPMQNTPLEPAKNYVLADAKTKLKYVDGTTATGVSKFVAKAKALTSTANFVGKTMNSVVENPHMGFHNYLGNHTTLLPPTLINNSGLSEFAQATGYAYSQSLNGVIGATPSTLVNGAIAQQLFAFNIIEEIERKLGRIPKSTVAEKVQWLKDNLSRLAFSWHGYGSHPTGNKATIKGFDVPQNTWNAVAVSTSTSNTVSKMNLVYFQSDMNQAGHIPRIIDSNGIVNFIAYAEPSNGTIASTINTDYVELVIELKPEAQLDTTPTITRIANFEGKVAGSTVDNPHISKVMMLSESLAVPSFYGWGEIQNSEYSNLNSLNGVVYTARSTTSGYRTGQLFSFDIIAEVERNIGRIPRATVAEKVAWLKNNLKKSLFKYSGFGSSVGGNRVTIKRWLWDVWEIANGTNHASNNVATLQVETSTSISAQITDTGFVHFLAYAEPSDGVTASIINTDYVELEIELKQEAILHDPRIPLYEVDSTEYINILTTWNADEVVRRYPKVEGVQHLQGLYVNAESENLIPPFTEWNLHAKTTLISKNEISIDNTAQYFSNTIKVNLQPSQKYIFSVDANDSGQSLSVYSYDSSGVVIATHYNTIYGGIPKEITVPSNAVSTTINVFNNKIGGTTTFKNPMLTLGSTPKPFTPRNPSYLYADVKLGAIGTVKDRLYRDGTDWKLRKAVEKDIGLDEIPGWGASGDFQGWKNFSISNPLTNARGTNAYGDNALSVVKYNGKVVIDKIHTEGFDRAYIHGGTKMLAVSVSDEDTGFHDTYSPVNDEIKAYFKGWKVSASAPTTNKPTAWVSVVDGSNTPTQTLAYVSTTKAPNYTPYKISYALATPVVETVTNRVEGDLVVNGLTQVEVGTGVVVREKIIPSTVSSSATDQYHINHTSYPTSFTKNKISKILNIYKNGKQDTGLWSIATNSANGVQRAQIERANFDATAEYTITYVVQEKEKTTVNPINMSASWAGNLKSSINSIVAKQSDTATSASVNNKLIIDILARLKAGNL